MSRAVTVAGVLFALLVSAALVLLRASLPETLAMVFVSSAIAGGILILVQNFRRTGRALS